MASAQSPPPTSKEMHLRAQERLEQPELEAHQRGLRRRVVPLAQGRKVGHTLQELVVDRAVEAARLAGGEEPLRELAFHLELLAQLVHRSRFMSRNRVRHTDTESSTAVPGVPTGWDIAWDIVSRDASGRLYVSKLCCTGR